MSYIISSRTMFYIFVLMALATSEFPACMGAKGDTRERTFIFVRCSVVVLVNHVSMSWLIVSLRLWELFSTLEGHITKPLELFSTLKWSANGNSRSCFQLQGRRPRAQFWSCFQLFRGDWWWSGSKFQTFSTVFE